MAEGKLEMVKPNAKKKNGSYNFKLTGVKLEELGSLKP